MDSAIVHYSGDWIFYNGKVASGAKLEVLDAGTLNRASIFLDPGRTTPADNPVVANTSGLLPFVWIGAQSYKVVLTTAGGAMIDEQDNIEGALDLTPFQSGAFAKPDTDITVRTSNYTMQEVDVGTVINANPTGGSFAITLMSAVTVGNGRGITIHHIGTANTVTVQTTASQTITHPGGSTQTLALSALGASAQLVSDGSNWHEVGDVQPLTDYDGPQPQGYLTLVNGTPIIVADATASSVRYTPFMGNKVPIWDGQRFVAVSFAELTLTLNNPAHTANTIFDVFVCLNSGAPTVATGPAWVNSGAGTSSIGSGVGTTQRTRLNGILVNAVEISARNGATTFTVPANFATYVGSIFIDASAGQVTCHRSWGQSRKWGVWNAYNRQPLYLKAGDPTASWPYTTNTVRASNGSSANSLIVFQGLAEEMYELSFVQRILARSDGNGGTYGQNGIGWNSTTVTSGRRGTVAVHGNGTSDDATSVTNGFAAFRQVPSLGINTVTSLEIATQVTDGPVTWFGTESNMELSANWRG